MPLVFFIVPHSYKMSLGSQKYPQSVENSQSSQAKHHTHMYEMVFLQKEKMRQLLNHKGKPFTLIAQYPLG